MNSTFSPVENEAPVRWLRHLRLVPEHGLGVIRRAVVFGLVAWLPLAAWALFNQRMFGGHAEPLLVHYGIHVRCLLVIPLLILAELPLHLVGKYVSRQLVSSGVVTPRLYEAYDAITTRMIGLRNATVPWVFAVGVAMAWTLSDPASAYPDALGWAAEADGSLRFGGAWFVYVARPILIALLVVWLWRLVLVTYWIWRVGRLPLALVAAHPDRMAGLGFIAKLPAGFALVTLAISAMFASDWAHQLLFHGATLKQYIPALIAYAVGWSLLLFMPAFAIMRKLWATRWRELPRYAALAAAQGRDVHGRWIDRSVSADDAVIEPEGLGVMADMGAVYETVSGMRVVPIDRFAVLSIAIPMAVPFLVLAFVSLPLDSILQTLLSVLA